MVDNYVEPNFDGFNCPHCGAYAHQEWYTYIQAGNFHQRGASYKSESAQGLALSYCSRCNRYSLWVYEKMVYPKLSIAPLPLGDMPENVKEDYLEARNVLNESPRSAGALLRLALQKLMPHLGESGKNLNTDIGNLVKKGLSVEIQKALDSLRVIGNESVHPGELDLKEDFKTAQALFNLINLIVERMIVEPKKIEEIYKILPENKKEWIKNRDM